MRVRFSISARSIKAAFAAVFCRGFKTMILPEERSTGVAQRRDDTRAIAALEKKRSFSTVVCASLQRLKREVKQADEQFALANPPDCCFIYRSLWRIWWNWQTRYFEVVV